MAVAPCCMLINAALLSSPCFKFNHDLSVVVLEDVRKSLTSVNNNNNNFQCLIFKLSQSQYDYKYSMNG